MPILKSNAKLLADYILSLSDFRVETWKFDSYNHIGAILTDSILQAGLNYESVVKPRVMKLLRTYPEAATTPGFNDLLLLHGTKQVLEWQHDEKPRRVEELTKFLLHSGVYTKMTLQNWLESQENCNQLLALKGIGQKTVDYMKNLAGIQTIAIDRHARTLVRAAGLSIQGYQEIQNTLKETAHLLQISACSLDRSIWKFSALTRGRIASDV